VTPIELLEAIENAARLLPAPHVEALARAIEKHAMPTPAARSQAISAVPLPAFAHMAGGLLNAWERSPEVPAVALALALRAAAGAASRERAEEQIDVVWTGPRTSQVPVRLTREVLLDVIGEAECELFIVSFAAYKVESIVAALKVCSERGARIRLILETDRVAGGSLTVDAARAFEELRNVALFYIWPAEKRPLVEHGRAALHAKAAVADDRVALVTSANLTGHAMTENMELGLLIRGGPIPGKLAAHFRELIAAGFLETVLS
jgi:phosphatidylserine/phosphatidylglycerophosphate/cardiolipin synthase-like enzyme